ncbi:uncharacterized protein LOC130186839 [Seriola aureovittata]|uniref:uncharacterized protein LOC130186839 n=1 Tax=Seriola aureovittata TaxID=2871759 RepID=UPI0024BEF69E|nr:uncharacterized protein LOC130186839 [Seriola aureovittata]
MASTDYVLENAVIDNGPPVRYRLTPNKTNLGGEGEEESKVRRWTIGKKDPSKQNKTILLVGETGSGKSSLINTFLNFVMGVKDVDEKWFEIVDDAKKHSTLESQTSKVTVYEIFSFEGKTVPYSLTIIDTPGYGDTRGIEHDAIINQMLYDLFSSEDGIQELDAVGLVLKAAENRLSDRLRYVFDSVMSLFGKDMEKNVVALITHSDGMPPENALKALDATNIKCARNEKNQPVYFSFNNCLSTQRTEETEFGLGQAWTVSTRGMHQLTSFLEKTTPQELDTTVNVLNERIRLAACINNLTERIDLIKLKQQIIQQTQEELEKHRESMKKEDNFTIEVDEHYKEKETTDGGMWWLVFYGGAVTCKVCKENCHYPGCTMAWYPNHCQVMKGGRCTSCTRKCPVSDHVKENKIYVNKTRKVKRTIGELKQKYKADEEQCENLLSALQTEKEKLEKEKDTWLDEAYQHVLSLEQIALNVNSLFTHAHLDFLIDMMKERRDTEKVQKLEEMVARVDEGTRAALRYIFSYVGGKATSLVKAAGKKLGKK